MVDARREMVDAHLSGQAIDFADLAVPESAAAASANARALADALLRLRAGGTLRIGRGVWHVQGGVCADGVANVRIVLDGTLRWVDDIAAWPRDAQHRALPCLAFGRATNLTLTSASGDGVLDGNGQRWWGMPGIGYLWRGENRPRLLLLEHCRHVLVERVLLRDSPYWTAYFRNVDHLEARHVAKATAHRQPRGQSERTRRAPRGQSDRIPPICYAASPARL